MSTPISSSIFPAAPLQRPVALAASRQSLYFGMAVNAREATLIDFSNIVKSIRENEKPSETFYNTLVKFVEKNKSALDQPLLKKIFDILGQKKNPYLLIAFVDAVCQAGPYAKLFQPYAGEYRLGEVIHQFISGLVSSVSPGKQFRDQLFALMTINLLFATKPEMRAQVIQTLKDDQHKTGFGSVVQALITNWQDYHRHPEDVLKPPADQPIEKSYDWLKQDKPE